jgi:hypothetical protein
MRFYDRHHQYYCGVDLHASSMYWARDRDPRYVFGADNVAAPRIFERKSVRRISFLADQSSPEQSIFEGRLDHAS